MATDSTWDRFGRWRRTRPFWGGVFLLVAAIELFLSGNLTLKNLQVHIGETGFLLYLLPVILILCAVLTWITPPQRLFYGIIALLTSLYSFLGLNLGGFFLGMLLGIVGGALIVSWGPPKVAAPTPVDGVDAEPGDPEADDAAGRHAAHYDPAATAIMPGFGEHDAYGHPRGATEPHGPATDPQGPR